MIGFVASNLSITPYLEVLGLILNSLGFVKMEKSLIPILFFSGLLLGQGLSIIVKKNILYLLCFVMGNLLSSYFSATQNIECLSHVFIFYWINQRSEYFSDFCIQYAMAMNLNVYSNFQLTGDLEWTLLMQVAHILLHLLSFFLVANRSSENCQIIRKFLDLQEDVFYDKRDVI